MGTDRQGSKSPEEGFAVVEDITRSQRVRDCVRKNLSIQYKPKMHLEFVVMLFVECYMKCVDTKGNKDFHLTTHCNSSSLDYLLFGREISQRI